MRALAELRTLFMPPAAGAPVAMGAAPTGDPYIVPSMMAAAVLADLGYLDHNLGPEVPMPVLDEAAGHYRPRIVWLAMSVVREDDGLAAAAVELADRLARRGATLVLGGRGVPPLARTGGLLRFHSMAELAAFARGARAASTVRPAGDRQVH